MITGACQAAAICQHSACGLYPLTSGTPCRSFMPNHPTIMHGPMLTEKDLEHPESMHYNPDRQLLDRLPNKVSNAHIGMASIASCHILHVEGHQNKA